MPAPFKLPRFYPILDTQVLAKWRWEPIAAAEGLIEGGAKILQYRHKDDWRQIHFNTAKHIAKLCQEAGVLFVLNDRVDFAQLLGAAVHIGQDDLPPVAARRLAGDAVMGFSTHNRLQLQRADEEPVQYLSIGPIFETSSKHKPDPVVGLERLQQLRALTAKPLVAIGGITQMNARAVIEAGADSVSIISGFLTGDGMNRKALRDAAQQWISTLAGTRAADS